MLSKIKIQNPPFKNAQRPKKHLPPFGFGDAFSFVFSFFRFNFGNSIWMCVRVILLWRSEKKRGKK